MNTTQIRIQLSTQLKTGMPLPGQTPLKVSLIFEFENVLRGIF